MSPKEIEEQRKQELLEFNSLKTIFGGLLLENNRNTKPEDVAYYQRKFKEAQQNLKR
jgi:hypothetical protein